MFTATAIATSGLIDASSVSGHLIPQPDEIGRYERIFSGFLAARALNHR
jgi:hypothetical protein